MDSVLSIEEAVLNVSHAKEAVRKEIHNPPPIFEDKTKALMLLKLHSTGNTPPIVHQPNRNRDTAAESMLQLQLNSSSGTRNFLLDQVRNQLRRTSPDACSEMKQQRIPLKAPLLSREDNQLRCTSPDACSEMKQQRIPLKAPLLSREDNQLRRTSPDACQTEAEDSIIIENQKKLGNKWVEQAKPTKSGSGGSKTNITIPARNKTKDEMEIEKQPKEKHLMEMWSMTRREISKLRKDLKNEEDADAIADMEQDLRQLRKRKAEYANQLGMNENV